ncbi:hypothetical protein RHOSPDRAFT_36603 [Rhodotorula sp. JG-1b]|nr:hypothetical protein RHOSPDRAFT_36603 [Rhodotorula sp. JG-1b]
MPTPILVLSEQVDAEYRVNMSWDFEAKLSDVPPVGFQVVQKKLDRGPLRGDWHFNIRNEVNNLAISILHVDNWSWSTNTPQPTLKPDGQPYDGYNVLFSRRGYAGEGKLPLAAQSSVQKYRFTITLTQEPEGDFARLHRTPTPDSTKVLQLANLLHSPSMDVRLLFKRADDVELELWTTADFLGKASDYYKALFASGAAETVMRRTSKRQETDAFLVEHDWMSCMTTKQDAADLDYQQIEVRETAYSTMCAVLLYLQTGHIKFAPIRSSHALPPDELATQRLVSLATSVGEHPTLPPPVSPKSVYRLAHLIERDELQKMAPDSLASSLTISGAAAELFSPVSVAYEKSRKIVFDFVVKNWKEVKATEAWRTVRAKVTSAPTEGAARFPSTCTVHKRHADVCLRFRRPGDAYLELWTTSGLLTTASDYYKTLLASGYAETVPSGSKRQRSEALPSIEHKPSGHGDLAQPTIDWQDSDDEMDDLLVERDWAGCKTAKHDSTDPEYQQIDVRETAYSTMSAVLLYLMTGHIEFAPLNSLLAAGDQDEGGARRTLLDKHMSEHPTLPPPVSPKSTILKYVVENWAHVQATGSWKEWRAKVAADEVPGGAAILADLLGALYEGKF